jgi:hypothetical protein
MTPQLNVKTGRNKKGLSDTAITGIGLDALGSAEVLPITLINIDPDYQRDIRHELVNKIGREYDIVKAGPILVSAREDGSIWCVDGQHRMMGALQAGETEIFAHVVHGLSQAEEAELRLARNDRRSDSIQEKFRTRLVMGDKKAHHMMAIVEAHDTEINVSTGNVRHGINSITTLELLYDLDGTGVWLDRVLHVIGSAFEYEGESLNPDKASLNPDTASTSMLKAVAWFLGQHVDTGEVSQDAFIKRLGQTDVDDLRRKAVSHRAINGGSNWLNHYRAIVEHWNFRRTDAKKLRAKTVGSVPTLGAESSSESARKPRQRSD